MSPKELLYIEDTLGHEKQINATCKSSADELTNEELSGFVKAVGERHTECFNKFYKLIGG